MSGEIFVFTDKHGLVAMQIASRWFVGELKTGLK
jgi:hypothetical protein